MGGLGWGQKWVRMGSGEVRDGVRMGLGRGQDGMGSQWGRDTAGVVSSVISNESSSKNFKELCHFLLLLDVTMAAQ